MADEWEEYADEIEEARKILEIEDIVDGKGNLLDQQPAYDKLINTRWICRMGIEYNMVKLLEDPQILKGTWLAIIMTIQC